MKSAAFSPDWLDSRLASLLPEYPHVSLCVALSGGVDSVALLAALASRRRQQLRKRTRLKSSERLRAIHVHHGLHPNADKWTEHCERLAAQLRVPLTVIRVKVRVERSASIEAAARDARYAKLAEASQPGEVLLTAHHQDDQLETVFLQLLRGAGVPGLAAMPETAAFGGGQLVRPLLECSRAQLEDWVRAQGLTWVEDDSNANEQFDRNYLRRKVLPGVLARWPGAASAVSRSARHAAEARRLLDSLARADVELASIGASLSVQRLRALDGDRRRNALRYWIAQRGIQAPDTKRLNELAGPVLRARADANPEVAWSGGLVARNADLLSIRTSHAANIAEGRAEARLGAQVGTDVVWRWREPAHANLPTPAGTLRIELDRHGPVDPDALATSLIVRTRRGGEKLRPRAGGPTRALKTLLQEARVPPAERERLPLIFAGDRLIAVADRWLDASVQATRASRQRARIHWRPK